MAQKYIVANGSRYYKSKSSWQKRYWKELDARWNAQRAMRESIANCRNSQTAIVDLCAERNELRERLRANEVMLMAARDTLEDMGWTYDGTHWVLCADHARAREGNGAEQLEKGTP